MKKNSRRPYYCLYTLCFVIAAFLAFWYFPFYRKSFIWKYDGLYQHYNSLVYYGKYLRSVIRTIFVEHSFSIPLWDMSIGYGSDIITTFSYYVLGDPLALLSVFVPAAKTEYLYSFLILLRLYLAGISFSCYCRYHKNDTMPTLLGALAYAFCGFAVFATLRHPFFANPMIYLPLFLLGVDKIFDQKKPWLFIAMTALSAISNFYFFYMLCMMVLIYTIFRYLHRFGRIAPGELFPWIGRFLVYVLTGTCIAAVTLLPSLMSVLLTDRMSASHYVPAIYPLTFYMKLPGDFLSTDYLVTADRYWTILGFVPLVLLAVFALLVQRKKHLDLKLGLLVISLCMLLPFIGHVINGFSYASNRWGFGYAMLFCYLLVKMCPEFVTLKKKQRFTLSGMLLCYALLCLMLKQSASVHVACSLLLTVCITGCIFLVSLGRISQKGFYRLLLASLFIGVAMNAWFLNAKSQTDYTSSFRDAGTGTPLITTKAQNEILKQVNDPSLYRYDQYGMAARENTAMQKGLYGTDYYFSVNNSHISQAFDELREKSVMEWMYDNLDGRTIMDRLAAVKYFIIRNGHEADLPYSYDTKVAENKNFSVYQSKNSLPFVYAYDTYISRQAYDGMTTTQKQQAMLQGVVLDSQPTDLAEATPAFTDQQCPVTLQPDEHMTVSGNTYTVLDDNAVLTLTFAGLPDAETYLLLDHVTYEGKATNFKFSAATDTVTKDIDVYTFRNNFYSGKDDFLCNMGYNTDGLSQIRLTFPYKGTYTIDDLYVVCQPMAGIEDQVQHLKEISVDTLDFSCNHITASVTSDAPRFLVFSVAYSDGWTAYVDGQRTALVPANTMYMGLELPTGSHSIELRYRTPYLGLGIGLSVLSLLLVIGAYIYSRRKHQTSRS